jgi:hypothetical protein
MAEASAEELAAMNRSISGKSNVAEQEAAYPGENLPASYLALLERDRLRRRHRRQRLLQAHAGRLQQRDVAAQILRHVREEPGQSRAWSRSRRRLDARCASRRSTTGG